MKKVCRLLFSALAGFLLFMGSIGLLSIKAEAKNGQDAANDIDGIYIHEGVEDRLAIEKDGIVLDGYNLSGYNVYIRANNVTVKNCTNITYVKLADNYKGITVENNTIIGSTDNGIIIAPGVTNSKIIKNNIKGTKLTGINADSASNCTIDGNTITGNGGSSAATHSIFVKSCSNMTISNNIVTNSENYGITLRGDNGSTVSKNKITNSACGSLTTSKHGDGLLLNEGCKGTQVLDNTVDTVGTVKEHYGNGIIVGIKSSNITVKGNTVKNAGFYGIQVTYGSQNIKLDGNTVTKSKGDGINISRNSSVDVINNKVYDNANDGKYSEGGNGIVFDGHEAYEGKKEVKGSISKNECYNNKASGILVTDCNTTISENKCHDNRISGIRVEGAGTHSITNNELANNAAHTGLHLLGTSKCTVTSNNIYKNSPDMDGVGIRLEWQAQATLTNNRISNYGESAVFADKNTVVKMSGNQANIARKEGFKEYNYAYFISESTGSDINLHNNLYTKEITTTYVKGLTHYNGYLSGAVVNGTVYQTNSASVEENVNIYVTFPAAANTNVDTVVLFTVDDQGNSICINASKDFKLTAGAADEEQVKAFVVRFYKVVLDRSDEDIAADSAGVNDWTNKLVTREKTGADVAKGFAMSKEFKNKGLGNKAFVTKMYKAFFNRDPDEGGFNGWIKKLDEGYSREYVLAGFVNSQEFKNLCATYGINPGSLATPAKPAAPPAIEPLKLDASGVQDAKLDEYVERMYTKILKRDSEADGKAYWSEVIKNGQDAGGNVYDAATAASRGFFKSAEYKNQDTTNAQFVLDCYMAFFNRDPRGTDDEVNYQNWVDQLNNEQITREYMIEKGFGKSKEFKILLGTYGFKIVQ